jgi:hypothetical protein
MDPHDGYGGFGGPGQDHFGAWHPWAGLLFMGASLAWLLAPLVITAAYLWWRQRRPALAGQPRANPLLDDDPSAFELLRRRYVVGEIDTPTFEVMTERLLLSERAEELNPPLARPARYDRYLRRPPHDPLANPDQGEPPESEPRTILL